MVECELVIEQENSSVKLGRIAENSRETCIESEKVERDEDSLDEQQPQVYDEIDLELVSKIRELLKADYESQDGKEKYASIHYEQIMDPNSSLTCWRYLIHCDKNLTDTLALMVSALIWRKENKVDEIKDEEFIKEFWHFSPVAFTGKSKVGRDVLFVLGKCYRKPDPMLKETIKRFCTNIIFSWDKKHNDDLQQMCIVFDVSDTGFRNIDLDYMTWLVSIRDFIPARIGSIYVIGIPLIVRPLINLIISWLPDKFSRMVHCGSFERLVLPNIDLDNIPVEVGGTQIETYRVAPATVPWAENSPIFGESQMQKAIEDSIGFSVSAERREKLCERQINYENNLA